MPKWDLNSYETVETRINRFYEMHPDGRIITEDLTTESDRLNKVWRVKTTIFLTDGDQAADLPKATGHAFEIDGQGMAISKQLWRTVRPQASVEPWLT